MSIISSSICPNGKGQSVKTDNLNDHDVKHEQTRNLSSSTIFPGDNKISEMVPVTKGETILTSLPFAYILKGNLRGLHCDNCLRKKQSLRRCSGCASCYYCNFDCQKTSWIVHKKECKKLKVLKPRYPPDTARLIARVIFKVQESGNDIREKVTVTQSRRFKDLMNHYEDIKEDPEKQDHFQATLVVLKRYLGEKLLLPDEELSGIFGRVYVNSFTIPDKDLNGVGLGVYLAASIFDHSCKPNIYASFNGTKLVVRALYDFPDLDFTKLRLSYIDILNTKEKRIKDLQHGYFFTCDCSLCSDESRDKVSFSINCGNAACFQPAYVGFADESAIEPCSKCGFNEWDRGTKEKYLNVISLTEEKLGETKSDCYLDVIKFLLEQQDSLLHKLNIWRVRTLDAAFESSINMTMWDDAVSYGSQNLDGMRFYYGSSHPMYGLSLLKLAKIELHLFKLEEAFNHLNLAEPILLSSHGNDNPIVCEDLMPLMKQAKQEIRMMENSGFKIFKPRP